jgi:hypothetical protein
MMDSHAETVDTRELEILTGVVDMLLPGGEGFPPASDVGTPGYMMAQLRPGELDGWLRPGLRAIDTLAGGDFLACEAMGQTDALRRAEREHPAMFDRLLALAYYSYYAQPTVVQVIRSMGFQYNHAPQPLGYAMEEYDPNDPEMLPQEPRGYYKRTEDVVREILP